MSSRSPSTALAQDQAVRAVGEHCQYAFLTGELVNNESLTTVFDLRVPV